MTAQTPALSQTLYFLDQAFEGSKWHSLIGNLQAVTDEDWLWVPPDGRRSIRDIVEHVAAAKLIYDNQAFGDMKLKWDDPGLIGGDRVATIASGVEWLKAAHARLRKSIAALTDDAELLRQRLHFSGAMKETQWLVSVMIEHDLYHAGEINHIRCLHQRDDA
jgi:uncharacterized damage-inducible protein DinB